MANVSMKTLVMSYATMIAASSFGIPSGHLYARFMCDPYGVSLDEHNQVVNVLTQHLGWVRDEMYNLIWVGPGDVKQALLKVLNEADSEV